MRLIEYAKQHPPEGRVERHHIVPRSMGGSNDKDNLVRLSPRLHFVAHWMLWKAFQNAKMANAFWTMACCNGERINSKTYDTVRAVASKAIADAKRGKTTSDRHKAIISAMMAGKVVSEETKKRISEAKKGKKFSPEHIAKLSVTKIGRKASEETKAKMSAAKKGKTPNNFGKVYKMKKPMPLELRLKLGEQRRGRVMSEESSQKKSLAMKGRSLSREHHEKIKSVWSDPEKRAQHSRRMKEVLAMKKMINPPVSPQNTPLPWNQS